MEWLTGLIVGLHVVFVVMAVIAVAGVLLAIAALGTVVVISLLDPKTFTPQERYEVARHIGRGRRREWGRPQQRLGEFLSSGYYADSAAGRDNPEPVVGALRSWWFSGGEWEGIPAANLALDGPGGRRATVEVLVDDPGELRPGTMIPYFPAVGRKPPRPAIELAPARIARMLADERLRRGLYDTVQHALVVDGVRVTTAVTAPRPTGRIRDGHVEVVVDTVDDDPVRCVGFVRPEEATGIRLAGRAPVCMSADRSTAVLGPFPW